VPRPVDEYQIAMRSGCSFLLYHMAVMRLKAGETLASEKPRKNLY
jgi:hypothetical protein